jgi:antitoxin MazE
MKTQILKLGNRLAIRIPKRLIKEAELKEGDWLEVEAVADGCIRLRRTDDVPTLDELIAQITPENRYSEV